MKASPFEVPIGAADFEDLRGRLTRTRWPMGFPAEQWSAGTEQATLERLVAKWADGFDWARQVAELNRLDHRTAVIDDTLLHFVYFAPDHPSTNLPLILTHGWPSTFLELVPLAERLAHPSRFGSSLSEARPVVVPSLPGFGYSAPRPSMFASPPTHELWHQLMIQVMGYARYGAHGGDLGTGITTRLAAAHPESVVGIHLLASVWPDDVDETTLTPEECEYIDADAAWDDEEGAYGHIQATRPVTLSYGLADSPVGLLAWLLEKYRAWSDCGGDVSRRFADDFILTQATIYWMTNTIASSFRPYFEFRARKDPVGRVDVPAAFAQFPHDLGSPPRSWLERTYDVRRHTLMPRGGHFAAHEEPELLAVDIVGFFAQLATSSSDSAQVVL
jgi:pimeloyl-ACP methyl ester carboxylesterase